jgi:hypothetical protein
MVDNQQIVGNEQIGYPQFLLQILKHVDDLCLNGNVQCTDRFIADNKLRIDRQRPGYADSLSLAA